MLGKIVYWREIVINLTRSNEHEIVKRHCTRSRGSIRVMNKDNLLFNMKCKKGKIRKVRKPIVSTGSPKDRIFMFNLKKGFLVVLILINININS